MKILCYNELIYMLEEIFIDNIFEKLEYNKTFYKL